jgi:phosphoribosylformimino-5-aminoimidazole carboxamide ribotide isomerase
MLVIPAIDLMGGEAVRLEKGDFATKKVYSRHPAEQAEAFRAAGATRLHVVDLDGAKAGWPVNLDTVRDLCAVKGIEVELGGGLRTLGDIEKVLALGVRYAVLGTAAVERLDLVRQACQRFPGQVVCGIDARNGEVKVAGWQEGSGLVAAEVARRVKEAGVTLVEYTDVARDGSLDDVRACVAAGVFGVIVGKAIYEGRIRLADAVALARSGA